MTLEILKQYLERRYQNLKLLAVVGISPKGKIYCLLDDGVICNLTTGKNLQSGLLPRNGLFANAIVSAVAHFHFIEESVVIVHDTYVAIISSGSALKKYLKVLHAGYDGSIRVSSD